MVVKFLIACMLSSFHNNNTVRYLKTAFILALFQMAAYIGNAQQIFDTAILKPRIRVIIDNDFGGDPDGLFQLTHAMLSPSIEVRAVIGSHLNANDGFDR